MNFFKNLLTQNKNFLFAFEAKIHLISQCRSIKIQELKLKEYGNPEKSVILKESELSSNIILKKGEIFIKLLGAPINPADLNIIHGTYALLPNELPANLGNEGVFEVIKSSPQSKFKQHDWIIPYTLGWGTWRSHAIEKEDIFVKIPDMYKIDKFTCASLAVNPCTAYRMLHDFVKLRPGDTIVQNGANSAVGQAVIQFAKAMDINVINIVRSRENLKDLYSYLYSLGAKYIITSDELRVQHSFMKDIKKPRLALNCVGGKATTDMVRLLDSNSVLVTYGGMSRQPLTFNTADFIFKNFKATGFWLSSWKSQHTKEDFENMLQDICKIMKDVNFKAPVFDEFKLEEHQIAFHRAHASQTNKKILFIP